MRRADDVLERNLELLLRRAFAPVLPRESFRAGLERDFLARAARLSGGAGATASSARRAALWLVPLAAAAALVGFLFAGSWAGRGETGTLEALLASGRAAARRDPAGEWLPVQAELTLAGGTLELATPAGVEARAASAAVALELHGGSHISVVDGERARLHAGGVALQRLAQGRPFVLVTDEGPVELVEGRVRVTHEPPRDLRAEDDGWVRVVARSGEALVGPERTALSAGREVFLRDGRVLDPSQPAGPSVAAGPGRASVASGPAAVVEAEPAVELGTVQVFGKVVLAGDPPVPVDDFQLVVLREVPLPQVAAPQVFPLRGAGGRFELEGLSTGPSRVFVRAPGRALWRSGPVQIGRAGETPVGPLSAVLELGVPVRGLVVDGETGLPVPGAVVLSETDAPVQVLEVDLEAERDDVPPEVLALATAGTDGGFELVDLTRGQQVFRAWAPGYAPSWIGPIEVGAEPVELAFELDAGGRVEGVVLDAAGQPVTNGLLVLSITDFGPGHPIMSYRSASTDDAGRFELSDVPEGSWTLLSFGRVTTGAPFEPALEFVQVFSGEVTLQDFRPAKDGVRMAGRLSYTDGAPVAGRSLWVIPATARGLESMSSTLSREDGTFAFPLVEPDRYVVFVSGRDPADMTVLGEVDLCDGLPRTELSFTLAGGTISGLILDAAAERPVQAASVLLLRARADGDDEFAGRALTGVDGLYSFEAVRPGRYQIIAYGTRGSHGHSTLDQLEVGPGRSIADLVLHLQPGGALELRILTPEGDPVRGAKVLTRNDQGVSVQLVEHCFTDSRGELTTPAMDAGRWTVIVVAEGFVRLEQIVDVPVAEDPAQLEVRLERAP